LATVHNALHPTGLIDAYVLIVYAGNGTYLDTTAPPPGFEEVPDVSSIAILPFRMHRLRDDLGIPVFVVNSETEAALFTTNDQAEHDHLRIWESPGVAHVGAGDVEVPALGDGVPCRGSLAPAVPAAYQHLLAWLSAGTLPPAALRLVRDGSGVIIRDSHGNARWCRLCTEAVTRTTIAAPRRSPRPSSRAARRLDVLEARGTTGRGAESRGVQHHPTVS
jgi:hypothetical protein